MLVVVNQSTNTSGVLNTTALKRKKQCERHLLRRPLSFSKTFFSHATRGEGQGQGQGGKGEERRGSRTLFLVHSQHLDRGICPVRNRGTKTVASFSLRKRMTSCFSRRGNFSSVTDSEPEEEPVEKIPSVEENEVGNGNAAEETKSENDENLTKGVPWVVPWVVPWDGG
jgi:hypothetical protein